MPRAILLLLGALALGVAGPPAHAGTLTSVTLTFELGTLPPASFAASGLSGAGSANGSGATATWSVAAGAVPGGTFTTSIPSSAAPPITGIYIYSQGNPGAGSFQAGIGGTMGVAVTPDITSYGGVTLLGIPLVIGSPNVVAPPTAYGIAITGIGTGWTTGATTLVRTTPTPNGATTAKRTGSNGLVNGVGTVVMVSAVNVLTNIAGQLPSFGTLTLTYAPVAVPEPGSALLLGAAALGVAGLGRRRRRSRRPTRRLRRNE